jgi:hypothetical protein
MKMKVYEMGAKKDGGGSKTPPNSLSNGGIGRSKPHPSYLISPSLSLTLKGEEQAIQEKLCVWDGFCTLQRAPQSCIVSQMSPSIPNQTYKETFA